MISKNKTALDTFTPTLKKTSLPTSDAASNTNFSFTFDEKNLPYPNYSYNTAIELSLLSTAGTKSPNYVLHLKTAVSALR